MSKKPNAKRKRVRKMVRSTMKVADRQKKERERMNQAQAKMQSLVKELLG